MLRWDPDRMLRQHHAAVFVASLVAFPSACRSDRPGPEPRPAPASHAVAPRPPATRQDTREAAPASKADPESGRLVGITAAHNRVRASVGVGPIEWSPELARYAQRWADKLQRRGCPLEHRPHAGPDAQRHGENIYSATGQAPGAGEVVDTWAAELADYDAKRNRCKGVCGHYTQIVWRASQRLGCAMAACGDTEVWVCNYDPPGNFMGQRPY